MDEFALTGLEFIPNNKKLDIANLNNARRAVMMGQLGLEDDRREEEERAQFHDCASAALQDFRERIWANRFKASLERPPESSSKKSIFVFDNGMQYRATDDEIATLFGVDDIREIMEPAGHS